MTSSPVVLLLSPVTGVAKRIMTNTHGIYIALLSAPAFALLACGDGSSTTSSSTSSSGAPVVDGGSSNPLSCPLGNHCPVYYCECEAGASTPEEFSVRAQGCATPEATCTFFCSQQIKPSPATEIRCGANPNPKPVEAGLPRGSAGGPCSAGDTCSERDFATCADLTVQLMRSTCPASGTCPTKTEAENTACAAHGGPQRI